MESIELIRTNLTRSEDIVLSRIEDMRDYALVAPTPNGGCHTLWVLGHLAYIESLVIHAFMEGESNPLAAWEETFDGEEVSQDIDQFPSFDEVLAECRAARVRTVRLLDSMTEEDLDREARSTPEAAAHLFGTYRQCFQAVADHGYMHRGHLADSRRAAGLERAWY